MRRNNQYSKKIATYSILLFVLFIVLATVGVDIIVQTTHFISQLAGGQKNEKQSDTSVLLAPELVNPPEATNSANLTIVIRGEEKTKVSVYLNDEVVEEQALEGKDEFEADIFLQKGKNTLYLIAESENGKTTSRSSDYTIILISEKPKLEISSPTINQKFFVADITVSGTTDKEIAVRVNGLPAIVDTEGRFSRNIQLSEGENSIAITATDRAGNVSSETRTVVYERE